MLEPGYDDDWYTAINDIRNNKVGNARLKLLKAYVGSKTDTRLTCPTSETGMLSTPINQKTSTQFKKQTSDVCKA